MLDGMMCDLQVVVMRVVWSLHSIATGHEDGVMCLWNMDSGTKLVAINGIILL